MYRPWFQMVTPLQRRPPSLLQSQGVDAGIKRQQFRRFCSSEKPAIGGDAVPTLWQFLNLPRENHAARVRQPPVWSNGDAPTVSDPSSHRSISRGSRFATNPNASGVAAAIITARRSLWIPNTAKYAGTARRSGAAPQPGLLAAVSRATPSRRRAEPPTAARSGPQAAPARSCKQQLSFRPKAFRCRDLAPGRRPPESCKQQLSSGASLDPGSTSRRRKPPLSESCKQQRPGSQTAFCRINESRTMLTTDQINDLHRLYWSERWPIRKIERHLHMGWHTIKKYLEAPAQGPAQRQRESKLDPFKATIADWLEKDPTVTAAVMEQRLRPLGYKGGHSILREYVHTVRPQLKPSRAFLRMEPPAGERFEVDWGHFGSLDYAGDKRKLYAFALVEAHSRMLYLEADTLAGSHLLNSYSTCSLAACSIRRSLRDASDARSTAQGRALAREQLGPCGMSATHRKPSSGTPWHGLTRDGARPHQPSKAVFPVGPLRFLLYSP